MIGFLILLIVLLLLDGISTKRQELLNFVSVIQLVTALNIANVSSSLHTKMFQMLVDVPTFFDFRFGGLQKRMVADVESLKAMEPNREINESTIETLANEYLNLYSNWKTEKKRIEVKMQELLSTKGINSLFLFISLYSVGDMFFIAYEFDKSTDIELEYWFGFFTLSSMIFSLWYFAFILLGKTKGIMRGKLYIIVSILFILCLLIGYFSYDINAHVSQVLSLWDEEHFLNFSDTMAIFLPFLGFAMCLIFIIVIWGKVSYMSSSSINNMAKALDKLHRKKLDLDITYNSYLQANEMQFS